MNPPHLRIQLLDCDAEEQQRDRSHIPNTNKLFDRIDRNLNNLYLATFAPGALAATLTALTRTDGRLIRPSSTRILQLNDTGQWTTVERDSLTGIGANVLLRHFDETFEHRQQRIKEALANRAPQHTAAIMHRNAHTIAAFRQSLHDICQTPTLANALLASIPSVPDFDKLSHQERDLVVLNGQLHAVTSTGLTAVSDTRLQVLSHQQFELQTSHGADKASFGETLFGNHPDATTVATFRSVFAAALLANRHVHNLIIMLTGDSSQLFVRTLQHLAASHASDSLPFSKLATCNIGAFDPTVLKHVRRVTIFADEAGVIASRCINRMSHRQTNTLKILVSADLFPPIEIPKHLRVLHFHLSKDNRDMSPAALLQWLVGGLREMHTLSHVAPSLPNAATLHQRAVQDLVARYTLLQAYTPTQTPAHHHALLLPIRSLVPSIKQLGATVNSHVNQRAIATALEHLHYKVTRPQNVLHVLVHCDRKEKPQGAT